MIGVVEGLFCGKVGFGSKLQDFRRAQGVCKIFTAFPQDDITGSFPHYAQSFPPCYVETSEAPPAAEKASLFRGTAPVCGPFLGPGTGWPDGVFCGEALPAMVSRGASVSPTVRSIPVL